MSAILYGNLVDLYVGIWGALEFIVDPHTEFAKGTTRHRAIRSKDISAAHTELIAAMKGAIAALQVALIKRLRH